MKNILITGGAGFIGSNLALKLLAKGYNITVLDNLSKQIHGDDPERDSPLYKSIQDKVNFIKGDVSVKEDWLKALIGQDAIVHFAAETGTGQSMYQIHHYTEVNIGATALLLDILTNNKYPIQKIVVASSRSIYGEGKYQSKEQGFVYPSQRKDEDMATGNFHVTYPGSSDLELVGTDEDSKIHPSSLYGISKQVQEQLIMTLCPNIGIKPVALRYQNVYGPGQSLTNPYTGILSIFSTLIKDNKGINIFEDGNESRDFVYIDDVVSATIMALEKDEANNGVFNVGSGVPTSVLTVAETLVRKYQKEVPITVTGNYRIGDIRHNYADLTKITKALGFIPTIDFETGIGKFADWVSEQAISSVGYETSLTEMKSKGLFK